MCWNKEKCCSFNEFEGCRKIYPNLTFHRDTKQSYEIHNENGPENWNIEDFEERTDERNCGGLGDSVPEFELG